MKALRLLTRTLDRAGAAVHAAPLDGGEGHLVDISVVDVHDPGVVFEFGVDLAVCGIDVPLPRSSSRVFVTWRAF